MLSKLLNRELPSRIHRLSEEPEGRDPDRNERDSGGEPTVGVLERFLKITGPFILRRVKTDRSVISDLPDKVINNYYATLEPDQAALYQNVLETIMEQVEHVDPAGKDGKIQRRGLVLKLIMALKQVCNHPSQYLKKKECPPELSGKTGLFLSLLGNILGNNEKVLVFN